MTKSAFCIVLFILPLFALAEPDSLLFKQKIARWDIGLDKAFHNYNSIGFVFLTKDSLVFESREHKDIFNFAVSYSDIVSVKKSWMYLTQIIIKIRRKDGKVFQIGGTYHIKKLMIILREQTTKAKEKSF